MKKRFCDLCGKEADLPGGSCVADEKIGKLNVRVLVAMSGICGDDPDLCKSCFKATLRQIADKL